MSVIRRHAWRTALMLVPMALALLHVAGWMPMGFLHRLDDAIYDLRISHGAEGGLDPRIVIVDIDEQSLAEVGRWPWSRDHVAALIDHLFNEQHIRMLGMDTVFAEPDPSGSTEVFKRLGDMPWAPGSGVAEEIRTLAKEMDHDARLARALQGRPVVLGYYFTSDRGGRKAGQLPSPLSIASAAAPGQPATLTEWNGYGANLPVLAAAAPQGGFFNAITDGDGVVRALPLLASHEGSVYESLVLAMFRRLLGMPDVALQTANATDRGAAYTGLQGIRLTNGDAAPIDLPVDGRGAALVPFRGAGGPDGGAFTYVSAVDVLKGRLAKDTLAGRVVLLGTTAPGLQDLRTTPMGEAYPGVEVHANLLAGLMDGRWLARPDYAAGAEWLILCVLGFALVWVLPRLGAVQASAAASVILLVVIGLNQWLFQRHGLVLPLAATLAVVLLTLVLHMGTGYFVETRARRQLARQFGTYVPPEIVEAMLRDPDRYGMSATTRELTVLFCDMKGFTALSETLAPQQLQELLNAVFSRLSAVVRRHQGTIDKYMGDCLMAFWGAPLETPDHARRATLAALAIVEEVASINQEHRLRAWPTIGVGVGLSTGPMCVGDMGSDIRRSYTVIGDAVNLGARLEGLSRVYGVDIVASDATREQAPEVAWQEIDRVRVKGKAQAVAVHQPWGPVGDVPEVGQHELAQWRAFRQAWFARDWSNCEAQLKQLRAQHAKKVLYQYWTERVALMKRSPPASDWDGVTDHASK